MNQLKTDRTWKHHPRFSRTVCLVVIAFFSIIHISNATVYYTRKVSAYWANTASWSTDTFGGAPGTATPGSNDTVRIGDGSTIYINSTATIKMLEVGQGAAASRLEFYSGSDIVLTVTDDITVNTSSLFLYNSNNNRTHTLNLGRDFYNNGSVNFYRDSQDKVDLNFDGSANAVVSGTGSWILYNVTVNKFIVSNEVEVQVSAFESAIYFLSVTTGTYVHNNSGNYIVNSDDSQAFTILKDAAFRVPQGSITFSPGDDYLYLNGSLIVNGGNVYVANSEGNEGLRYDQTGLNIPYLEVSSGLLTVYGGITYKSGSTSDPFSFRMTGGNILLNNGSDGTSNELLKVNDVTTSSFYMSGGTITLEKHNSSPGNNSADWDVGGTIGSVVSIDGTVLFGNSSTSAGTVFDFVPKANVIQPHFRVSGPTGATVTLATAKSTIEDFKLLSLYIDTLKIFDIQSIQGVPGNSKKMTLTSSSGAGYGFFCNGTLEAREGTVVMGSAEPQLVGGTASVTFYNLTIDNQAFVTLEKSESVSNLLNMTTGNLFTTSSKIIICTSTANANMGSALSFVDGPMIHTVATTSLTSRNFPIGKGSSYRPSILSVTHSNGNSVTYSGEMFNIPATSLGFGLPPAIASVSAARYWNFTRQTVSNLVSANMTLYYDTDDGVTDMNKVRIVHDDGASNWVDYGGTGTANNTGNITSGGISLFNSKFSLGFAPAVLPIELLSFYVKQLGDYAECHWYTAAEINNNYFTIERSLDGIHFDSLLSIAGAGNSNHVLHYSLTDENPVDGYAYYRLKQTDYDGRFTYSEIRTVHFERKSVYHFYPNPASGDRIHISNNGVDKMNEAIIVVQDMAGRTIPSHSELNEEKGEILLNLDPSLSTGNDYFIVSVFSNNEFTQEKILIGK